MAKLPSTRFPFVNVTKALERAEKIYESDRNGKGLKMPLAFAAWGYSEKSSGGFQTVGALLGYGIAEDEGSKEERVIRLTPSARLYFQSEIEDQKAEIRDKFARTPALFAHLLEHWDESTPPDNVARTYLKTEIGLNDQSARAALNIFKDNLDLLISKGGTKSSEFGEEARTSDSPTKLPSEVPEQPPVLVKVGDSVQYTVNDMDQFVVPKVVTNVVRDPERGWFVFVQGEKAGLPIEQVSVKRSSPIVESQTPDQAGLTGSSAGHNPIEILMGANGRLQVSANVDRDGLKKLKGLLEKYEEIFDLLL